MQHLLGGLPAVIKFPVLSGDLVRRVEDGVVEEWIFHNTSMAIIGVSVHAEDSSQVLDVLLKSNRCTTCKHIEELNERGDDEIKVLEMTINHEETCILNHHSSAQVISCLLCSKAP